MASDEIKAAAGRMQTKWYRSSKTVDASGDLHMDYIVDLCTLTDAYLAAVPTLDLARRKLEEIVCTVGQDRGVVMLSSDGPTHYDAEQKCQVYDHENFSPLGDALIELHDMLTGISSHPAADDQPITEEWLRGLGFVEEPRSKFFRLSHVAVFEANFLATYRAVAFNGDIANSIIVRTRGDLLRLLDAIGITPEGKRG